MSTDIQIKTLEYNEYGDPEEVLKVVDKSKPQAGFGEIVIKVHAASVNPSDWKRLKGLYKDFDAVNFPSGIGVEASGIVDEIGEGVTDLSIGDAVFGYGKDTMAEYAILTHWFHKPENVSFEVASTIPVVSETAWRCLDDLGLEEGSTILVSGASGGIGTAVIQLALSRGMKVIGTCSESKLNYIRALGAISTTYAIGLNQRIKELGFNKIDGALDIAGAGNIPELIEIVGDASHVVSAADFSASQYGARFSSGPPRNIQHVFSEVLKLYDQGLYKVHIDQTFPLKETAKAQKISSQKHVTGKLVIVNL